MIGLADELLLQQAYPPRIIKYEDHYATQLYSSEAGGYYIVATYQTYESAKKDFTNWTAAWDHIKKIIIGNISNSRIVHYYS
jgi:hypothetical protein